MNAEKEFGAGTGILKYSAVSTWLYDKLPNLAKILLTKKQIDEIIEFAVDKMKEYLKTIENKKITMIKVMPEGDQL